LLIGAGIFITASVALVSVFFASRFVRPGLAKKDPLVAERAVQEVGLKLAAGLAAAFAAVLTWGRLELSRQEHQLGRQQHANEVSGQLTERFTRAIDQLGSEKLDIRLGSIYAQERIARESQEDHGPIMEILTTYLREHSPWPPSRPGQYVQGAPLADVPALATRAADMQAIVTIVGRRQREHDSGRSLILRSLDLRNADLTGAHLERADLKEAHVDGAELMYANFDGFRRPAEGGRAHGGQPQWGPPPSWPC
jgi:hypothetical protein